MRTSNRITRLPGVHRFEGIYTVRCPFELRSADAKFQSGSNGSFRDQCLQGSIDIARKGVPASTVCDEIVIRKGTQTSEADLCLGNTLNLGDFFWILTIHPSVSHDLAVRL